MKLFVLFAVASLAHAGPPIPLIAMPEPGKQPNIVSGQSALDDSAPTAVKVAPPVALATEGYSLKVGLRRVARPSWAHARVAAASLSAQARAIALHNHDQTQYVGSIFLGSPAKEFSVIFDTGSASTWVYSESCSTNILSSKCSATACRNHKQYNALSSSTGKESSTRVEITYGSGYMRGKLYEDSLSLEGNCGDAPCKRIEGFHVIGAYCVSAPENVFDNSPFDGVMGLGFAELGVEGTKPLITALGDAGVLASSQRFFTFSLSSKEGDSGSQFSIGSIDKSRYQGELVHHQVIPGSKHWSLRLTGLTIGGVDVPLNCPNNFCPIVPDTGTSLLTGPSDIIELISQRVGSIKQDCTNMHTLPRLVFRIDNTDYPLDASEYVYREDNECYEGFYGMDMPKDMGPNSDRLFILGDSFLRRYFSVFYPETRTVGLAPSTGV